MQATKVTTTIKVETLSIAVLEGMLEHMNELVRLGAESGMLEMDDGDRIEWQTKREPVKF